MIALAIGVAALALFIIAWILVHLMQVIENAFLWHKDWIKFEKQYKRKVYQLETDLESEKHKVAVLRLELEGARSKLMMKK